MTWSERSYRARRVDASGAQFVEIGQELAHHHARVQLALDVLDGEIVGDADSDLAGAFMVLDMAQTMDLFCGGDESRAAFGYWLMIEEDTPLKVIFAVDVLRRARRTRH